MIGNGQAESVSMLRVGQITADERAQSRAGIDEDGLRDYVAELKQRRAEFPPVVVYREGRTYWLASGFHRLKAHALAGRSHINAIVRVGTLRDAILCSVASNMKHGIRRTHKDKERAISLLLDDPVWGKWTGRKIADLCGVSEGMVRRMVQERLESCVSCAEDEEDTEGAETPADTLDALGIDDPDDLPKLQEATLRAARKFLRHARRVAELTDKPEDVVVAAYLRFAAEKEAAGV